MARSGWPRTEEKLSLGRWIELEPLWLGVVRRRPVLCAHTALPGPTSVTQLEVLRQKWGLWFPSAWPAASFLMRRLRPQLELPEPR